MGNKKMKQKQQYAFKLLYPDGSFKIVVDTSALNVIDKFDLCTRANASIRLIQLSGEQEAIAFVNLEDD